MADIFGFESEVDENLTDDAEIDLMEPDLNEPSLENTNAVDEVEEVGECELPIEEPTELQEVQKGFSFEDYVKMTIDSGIAPFDIAFLPIIDMDSGFPIAYRTQTTIRSITMGVLPEKEYTYVSDKRSCGAALFRHNLQHIITAYKRFARAGRNIQFLSVRCPSELVESEDLFEILSDVLKKNPSINPSKLCLEFPASLLDRETDKARMAILDMKVLKVRTALTECAKEDFPLAKLLTVAPDFVYLDPTATAWAGSRNKPQVLPSLIAYIQSMGLDIIAEGSEVQRKPMRNAGCLGFFLSDTAPLSLKDAIAQKEESDEI